METKLKRCATVRVHEVGHRKEGHIRTVVAHKGPLVTGDVANYKTP